MASLAAVCFAAGQAVALSIQSSFADGAGLSWTARERATVDAAVAAWESRLGRHLPSGVDPTVQVLFSFQDHPGSILANWSGAFSVSSGTNVYPWTPGVNHIITFDSSQFFQMYFDDDVSTFSDVPSNRFDAYSIALHEIGHMLGFAAGFYLDDVGGANLDKWLAHVSGGRFDPSGLDVPLAPDNDHLSQWDPLTAGLTMASGLAWMERREISDLEIQMLGTAYGYELLPEPATSVLVGLGLCVLAARPRHQRRRSAMRNSLP